MKPESAIFQRPGPAPARSEVKVLFIIDRLCELGGAERVLLRTIDRLPIYGYSPHLVTFRIDEAFRQLVSCPLYVENLERTYDYRAFVTARRIASLIRSLDIRITHTFHETSDLWGGIVAKMAGCPILVSSRRDMGFLRHAKHRLAYRCLARYFDEVQTVSHEVRHFCIREDRVPPERVTTIHNGIDLPPLTSASSRAAVRASLGVQADWPMVVAVGHIRRIKGLDVLLRAAARVLAVIPTTMFVIAGADHDSAYYQELKILAKQLGVADSVKFLGSVQDTVAILRASDVFCLPSRSEGLSNALLEAMGCGLPCVVTNVGGNSEMVSHGTTGFVVENEDAASLAAALLEIVVQPRMGRKMGQEGRRVVEQHFTTDGMIQGIVHSYERLLNCYSRNSQ